jgi:signal transduction histidine kinase
MIEIVPPLCLAMASLFLGLALAAIPARNKRLLPHERMGLFGVLGGLAAAAACVCIALVPLFGRALLAFSTLFLWMSFTATCLRVHAWYQPLTPRFMRLSLLALLLAITLMLAQFFTVQNRDARIIYQLSVSLLLLGWMLYGLSKVRRNISSLQLDLMLIAAVALMLLLSVWSWTVMSGNAGKLLSFSEVFSEESLGFSMRLFVVSAMVLMLISANGYGLERIVSLNLAVTEEKMQSDHLNQKLYKLIAEKNEMLQILSFVARSENLPTIMSSLAHEINQPLGAIRLNLDYLMAEEATLSASQREEVLQQLVKCSNATTQVVKDFRRFMDTHVAPPVKVNLSGLLSDLVLGYTAELNRREVRVSLPADQAIAVWGDPVQLESALGGTLMYLVKRNSPNVRQMQITIQCIGRFVYLHIFDDCFPITDEDFSQALARPELNSNPHFNQSLWLCRAIIEHHGGAISRLEAPGQAGISLHLPLFEENDDDHA